MKIRLNDYDKILDYLKKERGYGNEFVAFLRDFPISKDELTSFATAYDAKEYCYEMSTDIDYYDFLSIRAVYRAMSEAVTDPSLLIEKDGVIDVAAIVAHYYRRLEQNETINDKKYTAMNENNLEYLQDQVKYTGFGEELRDAIKTNIEDKPLEFKLQYQTTYGNDNVSAELYFNKSKETDMYFFNKYDVSLQKDNEKESLVQTFYINKGNNITLKEAYNLMEGRSVNKLLTNKEGEKYNAWVQLDFKASDDNGNFKLSQFHQNYGFDLESVVGKHPIKELERDDYKANLLDSLKKGNLQSVTFVVDGAEKKQHIEANPKFKSITIYDENKQRVDNRQSKSEKQSEGEKQSDTKKSANQKKNTAEDTVAEEGKADKKKKRGQSVT